MSADAPPAITTFSRWHGPWWLRPRQRAMLGLAALVLAAGLVVALIVGATYQPVTYGMGAEAVQGQVSIRAVNDFGGMALQTYIPPQPAADGALIVSLTNTGSYPVTIEWVGVAPAGQRISSTALSEQAGPATYIPLAATGLAPQVVTGTSPKIAGVTLRPGMNFLVRIPFKTPACWYTGRSIVRTFWVSTKFFWWTHNFAVSWTSPRDPNDGAILSQIPDANGRPGSCPRR
jgi:hypothetical protein